MSVGGNATFKKDIYVEGDSYIDGSQYVSKNLEVNGDTYFHKNVTVEKNLYVSGDTIVEGGIKAKGDIETTGVVKATDVELTGSGSLNRQLDNVKTQIHKVGANAAALAALHPIQSDGDEKWTISAGVGNYGSETAGAAGIFYRPSQKVMFNVGATFGNDEKMVNGGVSFALDGSNGGGMTKAKLAKRVNDQAKTIENMGNKIARMDKAINMLMNKNSLMDNLKREFPDVPKNHWARNAVSTLGGNGIINGYPDGEFKGDKSMTRYEYAEMLFKAMIKGSDIERNMIKEYAPELRQVAERIRKTEILKRYNVAPTAPKANARVQNADARMQKAGQAYNARR